MARIFERQRIVYNRIKCLKCRDIIESRSVHDYRPCSCGACAVDGGHDYLRRTGDRDNWQEMSFAVVEKVEKEEYDVWKLLFGNQLQDENQA